MKILGYVSIAVLLFVLVTGCQPSGDQAKPAETIESAPAVSETPSVVGNWSGTLNAAGAQFELLFKVTEGPNGTIRASIDSISQGVNDIPVEVATFENGHLLLEAKSILGVLDVNFEGNDTLSGRWNQSGQSFPITLTRAN